MNDLEKAEWASDAAVMQEFKQTQAWAVLSKHMRRAVDYSLSIVLHTLDMNELLTQRGATVAIDHLLRLPENIVEEEKRIRNA